MHLELPGGDFGGHVHVREGFEERGFARLRQADYS
jgi:hypothetical protein